MVRFLHLERNIMADIPARSELKVTTGAIRGSTKIHVGPRKVAMREIHLEPSSGEPPVRVYDTSGPYTDPNARIDIMAGLQELRRDWIRERGDVEEVTQREVKPEDNGQLGPDRSGGVQPFPNVRKKVLRAKPGMNVSQMHYARRGIVTPEMEYVATRENLGRQMLAEYVRDGESWGASIPDYVTPEFVRDEVARGRAIIPATTSTTPSSSRWRSAAISWSRSTPISATPPSRPNVARRSTRWSGRSAGAPTRSWTCRPAATSTTPANGSCATRPCPIGTVPIYQALEKVGGIAEARPGTSSATR
jgi:phosphomethylpyrimidine synthase